MGTPVRPAIDGALATAEVTLGAPTDAQAWTVGQALPLQQIVASAGDVL
jgi:hypothetical protein